MTDFSPSATPSSAPASSLAPRLIKGLHADYEPEHWPGENTSGLIPYGDHVLIKMDTCSQATAGGIMLADDMRERMDMASESGCIYAVGSLAFAAYGQHRPKVGERVYVEKFAGVIARGADGGFYRVMSDTCVFAGLADPEAKDQPSGVGR